MVILSILTGILSFLNYFWQSNYALPELFKIISVIAQAVLTILTIAAMIGYQGKRSRSSYDGGHYKIWTFRFAVIIFSLLGNVSVLAVLTLHLFGIITML